MPRTILLALLAAAVGTALAVLCFATTTPATMTLFFFVGIPAYLAGMGLYAWAVIRDLKSHGVL